MFFTASWSIVAGLVVAVAVAAEAKQVEFKHHNNTELAETLQKVHNRCVLRRSGSAQDRGRGFEIHTTNFSRESLEIC